MITVFTRTHPNVSSTYITILLILYFLFRIVAYIVHVTILYFFSLAACLLLNFLDVLCLSVPQVHCM
jgi:hypothetical protein